MPSSLQSMGWVETGSCRRYSQSAGDSALASLPQEANNKGALPALRSQACSNFLCAQALKVAMQLSCFGGNQQVRAQPTCITELTNTVFVRQVCCSVCEDPGTSLCCVAHVETVSHVPA